MLKTSVQACLAEQGYYQRLEEMGGVSPGLVGAGLKEEIKQNLSRLSDSTRI
jgi:hypothetical protein